MREIKFRVWDTKKKKFDYDVMILRGEACYIDSFDTLEFYKEGRMIILQYTGLKDKNGKEIYEGDICIGSRYWCDGYLKKQYPKEVKIYLQVYWTGAGFSLKEIGALPEYIDTMRENQYRSIGYSLDDFNQDGIENSVEVIGNIHSNPDLLEVTP